MSLEHYGIVKMKPKKGIKRDKWSYFLEYKIDKLNRIIRFMGSNILKNCTSSGLYVNLFNKNKEKLGETVFVESGKLIPVFAAGGFQVSLNNNTWTHMGIPSYINDPADLKAESGKYKLSVSKKRRMHNQYIIEIRSPLIINNCLPKDVSLQFIQKGKTLSTKLIKSQVSHEVFAN